MDRFFSRIDKLDNNNINILTDEICIKYKLGLPLGSSLIKIGYEDFNTVIQTTSGCYLVKVFNNKRSDQDVMVCIERTCVAQEHGLPIPRVFNNADGERYSCLRIGDSRFRIAVTEFVNGMNYHQLGKKPSIHELEKIVDIAFLLSRIDYHPHQIYDEWGIVNFSHEYEKKREYLTTNLTSILDPIYDRYVRFDIDLLPKSFVHGDITSTNLIKDDKQLIWLVDFSVSNYMARIIEILVICSDLALIVNNKAESEERIRYCFNIWCEKAKATQMEIDAFWLLLSVANAINVMNTAVEQYNGNKSLENSMNMNQGLWGLSLFSTKSIVV